MKKLVLVHCLIQSILILMAFAHGPEIKTDTEIFKKWIDHQRVFHDQSLLRTPDQIDQQFWERFIRTCNRYTDHIVPAYSFLENLTAKSFGPEIIAPKLSFEGQRNFAQMYSWFEADPLQFLEYMKNQRFSDCIVNHTEQHCDINATIKRYKTLFKVLLNQPSKDARSAYAFSFANKAFESCFCSPAFTDFLSILNNPLHHQVARFLYTMIWFNLVGEGWKHWHKECLKAIRKEAAHGKEIVYIAGGNDIYQLLQEGVYRIRVIDPMLPSQPAYYAEGWDWLLRGTHDVGIGDKLLITTHARKLVLIREKYEEFGTFQATLSTGQNVTLPRSITTWRIYDDNQEKKLGYVIFERRFCNEDDFKINPKRAMLLSFNEMYFVAMPDHLYGWGINFDNLSEDLKWHIKQLRKPVTKKFLKNIRHAESESNFSYIMLGSNAT